LWEIGNYC
jgi:hypothetical protein